MKWAEPRGLWLPSQPVRSASIRGRSVGIRKPRAESQDAERLLQPGGGTVSTGHASVGGADAGLFNPFTLWFAPVCQTARECIYVGGSCVQDVLQHVQD